MLFASIIFLISVTVATNWFRDTFLLLVLYYFYSNKNTVNNGMNTFLKKEGFFFGFIVTSPTTLCFGKLGRNIFILNFRVL
jgi:hypothetical protein